MSAGQQIDVGTAIRLLLACNPTVIDEKEIRESLGSVHVTSAAAVARVFGVSYVTVKTSWRPGGMPGDAKAKQWPLAEILIWLLKRNVKNADGRGVDKYTDRKRDADTRKVESEARLKELAVEQKEGEYISVEWARSEVSAALNTIRDAVMAIGRSIMPFLPKKQAIELRDEIDRQCERHLTAAADSLLDAIDNQKDEEDDDESLQD